MSSSTASTRYRSSPAHLERLSNIWCILLVMVRAVLSTIGRLLQSC